MTARIQMRTNNLGESYIVRVYRCEHGTETAATGHSTAVIAGVVEHPVSGRRHPFQNMGELWALRSEKLLEAHRDD